MKNNQLNWENVLSDTDLENVIGGGLDANYGSIKQELEDAVNNNDFALFLSIVVDNVSTHGKDFLNLVVSYYTKTGFLTNPRFSTLMAAVVQEM